MYEHIRVETCRNLWAAALKEKIRTALGVGVQSGGRMDLLARRYALWIDSADFHAHCDHAGVDAEATLAKVRWCQETGDPSPFMPGRGSGGRP